MTTEQTHPVPAGTKLGGLKTRPFYGISEDVPIVTSATEVAVSPMGYSKSFATGIEDDMFVKCLSGEVSERHTSTSYALLDPASSKKKVRSVLGVHTLTGSVRKKRHQRCLC